MSLDQKVKIRGKSGWLRWSPRGYWAIHVEGFSSQEALQAKFLHPKSGEFDAGAIEAAKARLLARARAHFNKKKR